MVRLIRSSISLHHFFNHVLLCTCLYVYLTCSEYDVLMSHESIDSSQQVSIPSTKEPPLVPPPPCAAFAEYHNGALVITDGLASDDDTVTTCSPGTSSVLGLEYVVMNVGASTELNVTAWTYNTAIPNFVCITIYAPACGGPRRRHHQRMYPRAPQLVHPPTSHRAHRRERCQQPRQIPRRVHQLIHPRCRRLRRQLHPQLRRRVAPTPIMIQQNTSFAPSSALLEGIEMG